MYKVLYKNDDAGTDFEIIPKPINLEQYCEINECELIVEYDSSAEKDKKWYATVSYPSSKKKEEYVRGFGSTQLKAMAQLVDEINTRRDFPITITLGRKGWIKRTTYV
jgi:hypothetical protein